MQQAKLFSWFAFLKIKILKFRSALLVLEDAVAGTLTAIPIADAQVRVGQLSVGLMDVPRFGQSGRVVDPDVNPEGFVICLLPNLDRLDLIGVIRICALVDARL